MSALCFLSHVDVPMMGAAAAGWLHHGGSFGSTLFPLLLSTHISMQLYITPGCIPCCIQASLICVVQAGSRFPLNCELCALLVWVRYT